MLNFSHSSINFPIIFFFSKEDAFQSRIQNPLNIIFVKIVNGFQLLTIFEKKLHLRCLTAFWIRLCILKGILKRLAS